MRLYLRTDHLGLRCSALAVSAAWLAYNVLRSAI